MCHHACLKLPNFNCWPITCIFVTRMQPNQSIPLVSLCCYGLCFQRKSCHLYLSIQLDIIHSVTVDQAAWVKSPFKQVPSPRKPEVWIGAFPLNFGWSCSGIVLFFTMKLSTNRWPPLSPLPPCSSQWDAHPSGPALKMAGFPDLQTWLSILCSGSSSFRVPWALVWSGCLSKALVGQVCRTSSTQI